MKFENKKIETHLAHRLGPRASAPALGSSLVPNTDNDVIGTDPSPASAKGRVEHQRLNRTAALPLLG